ncbi:sensor histidine kinase [Roseofilum capinflatum]|uniref:histidine kinase n=1 Tax=Roseofilum capinflatum BLCC-M114 TaxID=3022440 RepID=A0ABT7B365_9CYAN|nr:sensor histidine kinase [Roseofilum capinflatum]MDJ1173596.1 sensor histidine kinase [Roseofilum capinflatum BLCC-M114]
MLRPASSEFIELCRSQISLLTQSLGASLSAVYLTEHHLDRSFTQLIPIAAYPDRATPWNELEAIAFLPSDWQFQGLTPSLPDPLDPKPESADSEVLPQSHQLILPLVKQKMLMGFLVTQRQDRHWNDLEREQIQQITNTLAIACLLDQRGQWSEHRYQQQTELESKRHELLHNFLHQFRNPLTALGTFGKLLLKRLAPADPNRAIAENMLRESTRLQDLLQHFNQSMDVLEQSDRTLESDGSEASEPRLLSATASAVAQLPASLGAMPLTLESCAIEEILGALLPSIEAIAEDKGLTLKQQIPDDLPLIDVDPKALTEVLNNLLENGIKYTPAPGTIYLQVTAHNSQNQLLIAISDTGPGIPPEDITEVFKRHYRGVQSQGEIPGTGLGLAIAKDLTEQMQGTLKVFSPAAYPPEATQGTTFVISLPIP